MVDGANSAIGAFARASGHAVRPRRRVAAAALAAAALACLAAAPQALAFGLSGLSAAPEDNAAGAHSDFDIGITIDDPEEQLKDLTVHLPPGLVGNPTVTPLCKVGELNADDCPGASQVGTTTTNVDASILAISGLPLSVNGSIYNLVPRPGEPARFGIVLRALDLPAPLSTLLGQDFLPPIVLQSGVALRKSDFGLDSILEDLPRTASTGLPAPLDSLETDITGLSLTLFGRAGEPEQPFLSNPTSCGTKTTSFDAISYANPNVAVSGSASYESVGCAKLPFSPAFSSVIGGKGLTDVGDHAPFTSVIEQDGGEANIRRAEVRLAPLIGADNAALSMTCALPRFEAHDCPEDSVFGTATARSPLLEKALSGPFALVANPTPGLAPRIGLDLQGPLALQLFGDFVLDQEGAGFAFAGLPDIPVSKLEVALTGGESGLMTLSRDLCEPPPVTFTANFVSQAGTTSGGPSDSVVSGCEVDLDFEVRKARSKHPRLRARLRAGENGKVRKLKVAMPRSLRVGGGKRLRRGVHARADGERLRRSAIRRGARRLTLNRGGGASRLLLKAGRRSLRANGARGAGRRGKRLRFKVLAVDVGGARTRFVERAPAP